MEARICRAAILTSCLLSLGASYRTNNFLVTAPTDDLSRAVAETAEAFRRDLAIDWLGNELPDWPAPCPITVHKGRQLGAGGATSFMFENRRPFGWTMTVQGSRERILDSVLPHEITHTIFATHFGRPLPRWADEGACTTVEHNYEKEKQKKLLIEFLKTGRGIAFNEMFAMREYPPDIMPLYSQGFSLARFLIAQGGKRKFVEYVGYGMQLNNWTKATQKHYGFDSLSELQVTWVDWVRNGSPPIQIAANELANPATQLAAATAAGNSDVQPVGFTREAGSDAAPNSTASLAQSESPRNGWYARVRDETMAGGKRKSAPPTVRSGDRLAPAGGSLSRQQPVGRPRQQVLEMTRETRPAQSYLVPRGTILR
jgi:hypothetical protein